MSPDRSHRARPPRLRADEQDGGGLCRQERWPLHFTFICRQNNTLLLLFSDSSSPDSVIGTSILSYSSSSLKSNMAKY